LQRCRTALDCRNSIDWLPGAFDLMPGPHLRRLGYRGSSLQRRLDIL
jgi:hypothetical protein